MWARSALKDQAKANLRDNYWIGFGVVMIMMGIEMGVSIVSSFVPFVALLVLPVLSVGVVRWFSRNRESAVTPAIDNIFSLFRGNNYGKTLGAMLWMSLFLFLWSLLAIAPLMIAYILFFVSILTSSNIQTGHFPENFNISRIGGDGFILIAIVLLAFAILLFIPAFIKYFSYRMTPWILADNPAIGYQRALKLSIDLTRGQKWSMFVLELSFLGWWILGALACGVGVFFVMPYYQATQAELYATLRQNGVDNGLCSMEELGFFKAVQSVPPSPSVG
jgi:uncharacterized membrane protein